MSEAQTTIDAQLEVMPQGALEAITRGEIDVQIATAHKFPRSMQQFKKRAMDMALLDEETAASCIYSRPVGKKKNEQTGAWEQQFAEGLSIRMAEIVGASYGNLRVGSMLVEQTERFVKARGFAHDLESNFAAASETVESTVKKDGTPYDERHRAVIAKVALAKALRDATFKVVPRALCKPIELEARKLAVGEGKSMEARRAAVVQWLTKLGIELKRVWASLGVAGESDLTSDHLATLTGLRTSIKDGEVTIEEAFPNLPKAPVQEPGAATQPATPPVETKPTEPPIDTIMRLIKETEGVTEDKVIAFAKEMKLAGDGVQQLMEMRDGNLLKLIKSWPENVAKIKGQLL